MVNVMITAPKCTTTTETYRHTFPDGDVDCRPETVTKQFKIDVVTCYHLRLLRTGLKLTQQYLLSTAAALATHYGRFCELLSKN